MSKAEPATAPILPLEKILDHLRKGVRSWEQLRSLIKVNDDRLGFMILTLMNERKIWTAQKNDVRVYGLERRAGTVSTSSQPRRRFDDR